MRTPSYHVPSTIMKVATALVSLIALAACDPSRRECELGCRNMDAVGFRDDDGKCARACIADAYDADVRRCMREATTALRAEQCVKEGRRRKAFREGRASEVDPPLLATTPPA